MRKIGICLASFGSLWIILCLGQATLRAGSGTQDATRAGLGSNDSRGPRIAVASTGEDSVRYVLAQAQKPTKKKTKPKTIKPKTEEPKDEPAEEPKESKASKPAKSDEDSVKSGDSKTGTPMKLSSGWAQGVTVDDLAAELVESGTRLSQNLKKPGDFDKFIKNINAEGHLAAVLAGLVTSHPNAGGWKEIAAEIQAQAMEVAQAAEAKGAKNFRTAQDAHKKMLELIKKGEEAEKGEGGEPDAIDWEALADLSHVMKRVDSAFKFLRGKMSNEAGFKKEIEAIRRQAAILAALSEVAPAYRQGEKDFVTMSADMSAAARAAVAAAENQEFDKAKEATTAINASCNDCHKAYRLDQTKDFNF